MYAREQLGTLLREKRLALDLRQADVAKRLKRSIPYLSGVERGNRSVTPGLLDKLTKILNLTSEEYQRAFFLRNRLPPRAESYFLQNPQTWPQEKRR